jgi:hypothetical protein
MKLVEDLKSLTIYKKIVIWDVLTNRNRGSSVISKVEDPSFYT